jgi:hypothetical protein
MNTTITAPTWIRRAAIVYAGVVTATALLISFAVVALMPGDAEGKLWAVYTWRLAYLPATVALGALSIVGYDLYARCRGTAAKVLVFLANSVVVAAIPYIVSLALVADGPRSK